MSTNGRTSRILQFIAPDERRQFGIEVTLSALQYKSWLVSNDMINLQQNAPASNSLLFKCGYMRFILTLVHYKTKSAV